MVLKVPNNFPYYTLPYGKFW